MWFSRGSGCLGLSGGELCFASNSGTTISCWRLNNFPSRDAVWVWKYNVDVATVVEKCREDFGLGGGNALGFKVRNMVFHDFEEAWRKTVHYKLFSYEWPQWPPLQ
ncbi:hypothetical protein P3S67_013966 [Capsicum chacoense]